MRSSSTTTISLARCRGWSGTRTNRSRTPRACRCISSRRSRESTSTVVLTGEGSDELLAGYGKYPRAVINWRAGGVYERLVPAAVRATVAGSIVPRLPGQAGRYARRSFLAMPRNPSAMFLDNFAGMPLHQQRELLSSAALVGGDPYAPSLAYFNGGQRRSGILGRLLLHRHQDLPRRAADEAGPDEHVGLNREPRAVPRSRARRVRRAAAGSAEAARLHDQAHPARGGSRAAARRNPHAQEDGLPRAVRRWTRDRWHRSCATCCSIAAPASAASIDPAAVEHLLDAHRDGRRRAAMPSGR